MQYKRQSTVEPVFGTLINFMGMCKINTRGIKNANKVMLMAAMELYLKSTKNQTETVANRLRETIIPRAAY